MFVVKRPHFSNFWTSASQMKTVIGLGLS